MQRFAAIAMLFALACNGGIKADDLLPRLRKDYEDCVYRSARSQGASTSDGIELAFQACQSNEQAIITHLTALGMAQATVEKTLKAFRLRLQKTLR